MTAWKRIVKYFSVMAFFGLLISLTWHFLARSDWNCQSNSVGEVWSSDRAYKATLLRKSCNRDESVSYTVRLDFLGSPSVRAWFVSGYELENDEYPEGNPTLRWVDKRKLEVLVNTRTLTGSLVLHAGNDLVFVRTYIPKEPNAFPNY